MGLNQVNDYGLTVVERSCPHVPTTVQRELEHLIVEASEVSTVGTPESVATATLRSMADAVEGHLAAHPELVRWESDLREIMRSIRVSRGAVISSLPDEVPSLARGCALDAVRSWFLTGDWVDRRISATEAIIRLLEEGADFDPDCNPADRILLSRARAENS